MVRQCRSTICTFSYKRTSDTSAAQQTARSNTRDWKMQAFIDGRNHLTQFCAIKISHYGCTERTGLPAIYQISCYIHPNRTYAEITVHAVLNSAIESIEQCFPFFF